MNENRSAARARVLLSGKILLRDGGVIDCVPRNRSETGEPATPGHVRRRRSGPDVS